jgi:hypothetical protein
LHLYTYIFTGEDMTQDEIITIAKEVGFVDEEIDKCKLMFERFAFLVAQNEREACAYWAGIALLGADCGLSNRVDQAIRARGQA